MKTEYEIERENRIRENDAMLESLFGSKKPVRDIRPSQDDITVSPSISEASSSRLSRSNLGQKQLYTAREVDYLLAKEEEECAKNPEDKRPPTRYILAVIELPRRSARSAIRRGSRAIKRTARDSSSDGEYRNHRPSKKSNIRRVASRHGYGSIEGSSCHQCRQKTVNPKAHCSTCNNMFDLNCLLQRYGETEEESKALGWRCPYCRGDCNCSYCRKKKGLRPTGILIHIARGNGYRSVSHYLRKDASGEPDEVVHIVGRNSRSRSRSSHELEDVALSEHITEGTTDDEAYTGSRSLAGTVPKARSTRATTGKALRNILGRAEKEDDLLFD